MMSRSVIVRPWLNAGLDMLLLGSEERVLKLRGVQADVSPVALSPEKKSVSLTSRNNVSSAAPSFHDASITSAAKQPAAAQQKAALTGHDPAAEHVSAPNLLIMPQALPVENWPETWLAIKNRRPLPPSPLVLWTYFGLGEDLTGLPDESRKKVIVRILMELRHPGGTHVFWPCNLPGEENGAALFWSGVKLLNPRVLLLFGSDARDVLAMPKTLFPFCEERVHGRLVVQMPRPQALADNEPSFQRVLVFLSRRLGFCARRRV